VLLFLNFWLIVWIIRTDVRKLAHTPDKSKPEQATHQGVEGEIVEISTTCPTLSK
jgi:hypothetical protein